MVPVMPLASWAASSTAALPIASGGSTISGGISKPPPPACQPSVSTTRDGLRQLTAMLSGFKISGEAEIQPLGGGLGDPVGVGALVDHGDPGGGDRHQRAAAACPHVRDDGLGHQEDAGEVDVEAQLPALERRGFDWAEPQYARVGDEDVDAAELGDGRLDRGIDRLLAGDVARDRQCSPTRGDDARRRPSRWCPAACPAARSVPRRRPTAPAAARDAAIVAPMPRLAPATKAILPASVTAVTWAGTAARRPGG